MAPHGPPCWLGLSLGYCGVSVMWPLGVSGRIVGLFAAGVSLQTPAPASLPTSTLPMALVGVAVDANAPSKSVAMITCTAVADSTSAMFRPGQKACDLAEVTEVGQDVVIIRNVLTNRLERLPLHNVGTAPIAAAAVAAVPPAPMIVKKSATGLTVDVPKAAVDHYLINLTEFLTTALATPHFRTADNGQRVMDGFELGQITPGGVIEQLGLRNGDVITDVNGDKLDSLAAVMKLAGQAQTLTQVTMRVLRDGKPLTFVFNTK